MCHSSLTVRRLVLHAENCAGKNKNKFVLWYLCWRTIFGYNEEVSLKFMVPGHTKNVADGSFGHIKRKLKSTDARTPIEMMNIIACSSASTKCVTSVDVIWVSWKDFLDPFLKIPSNFLSQGSNHFVFRVPFLVFCSPNRFNYQRRRKVLVFYEIVCQWRQ